MLKLVYLQATDVHVAIKHARLSKEGEVWAPVEIPSI